MKLIDKFAKAGEPIQFSVIGIVVLLAALTNIEEVRLGLKPYIILIGIGLFLFATLGFVLNQRQINIDSAKRKEDFEAMLARHDKMLAPFRKKK